MTTTITNIDTTTRIRTAEESERIGLSAYQALVADLRELNPDDWEEVTVCDPWTVADMVRHLVGAAKGNASMREMMRQQIHGARRKGEFGGNALDATNDLQVNDHRDLQPEQLIEALEAVFEKSVHTRVNRSRVFDHINVPIDAGGSTATGMPSRLNMSELFKVVYTRDVWLHRVDIARATHRELRLDPSVDKRIVEDVVKEWADRHAQPFELHLTGPAGGHYQRTGEGPTIDLDAIDFCWILSGRGEPKPESPGAALLAHQVLF